MFLMKMVQDQTRRSDGFGHHAGASVRPKGVFGRRSTCSARRRGEPRHTWLG
jgi:hypothetical protein